MSKHWTKEETKILIENYPDNRAIDLMILLPGRSIGSIVGKACLIKIRKSDFFHDSGMGGRICSTNQIGHENRFKKEIAGWNKGMKQSDYMSAENIEKTKVGRFKKGDDPHNTVQMGSERVSGDGYVEVKIRHLKNGQSKTKNFEAKHRIIYEREHGSIPKDAIIEFVDGNKANFDISNLQLVSRRDNLLKNSMTDQSIVKRFFGVKNQKIVDQIIQENPEIIQLKRNIIQVNQTIIKKASC
jgi:hypothetical protein